jgi:hypothetical protein
METIVSLFNSDIYTFIYTKKFHSNKVLKSHLQDLPLPVFPDDTHKYIYTLYHATFDMPNGNIQSFQAAIDEIICKTFSLEPRQYDYITGE